MPHTILIVDDSPTGVAELRGLLESEGFTVLTALRAEEALDLLDSAKVDIAVTEALLPGMDGFQFVERVRDNPRYTNLPVIMLTVRSSKEDYTRGFEAGANEYFVKPLEPIKLVAAVRGLIARSDLGRLERPPVLARSALPARPDEPGKVMTLFSLKGGVGTTTIAVNLAVAIKQAAPSARVGLIDLSLEQGHSALLLDVVPTSTIAEWAQEDLTEADAYLLNQYFVQHRTGVSLLAAPNAPEQAETVRPAVVRQILQLAPQVFDYVVVDTASAFNDITLAALDLANLIILPLTPDMASLKSATSVLRVLKAVKIPDERIHLILNEIVPRAGLTRQQMENSLGRPITVIPHAGADFIEAANQGMPIVTVSPPGAAARAIIDLARSFCEPEADFAPVQRATMSALMSRLERSLQRFRRAT